MRLIAATFFSFAVLLAQAVPVTLIANEAMAATPAEVADQVRTNWAKAKTAYLASVKPYTVVAANVTLINQYTAATDKAGATLEKYLSLKLAGSAPEEVTPVVDQLSKDLLAMKAIRAKATSGLGTALGTALTQQNLVTQTALANMR